MRSRFELTDESGLAATLDESGYALIRRPIGRIDLQELRDACRDAFQQSTDDVRARSNQGHVCAARNLIESVPIVRTFWQRGALGDFLEQRLGFGFGLVRVLFFDKPPDRTWALPWHKDRAIAVRDNSIATHRFERPTTKAGVPHVMAPESVLREILTLRVHLDDVTAENGPLRVVAGSHRSLAAEGVGVDNADTIYADAGDVLAMSPLLLHCSGVSQPGTNRHRRIVHLEFASGRELPDGFQWHDYVSRCIVGA